MRPHHNPYKNVRLRQIRLAGFKSFVDPTPIDVPGTLVGVVGPNGCGKSNVIDAVRWVLGESKAAELRGESMQDVIFNGSGDRKPAGRASVELAFDNNEGRIGGAWAQYAEISVKRVLTRDGSSSYYINNQNVRRRDVHDMFLGTGLGPRAYAIIGQGMISRIVEARPEELRIFLEEAAGVSKYKERRRETENRLADTRDNLTRVEDILRELDTQIGKLEQQAAVAQTYRSLQATHDEQQQLLWLTRRREADAERDKVTRDISNRTVALEAHVAELRGAERALEDVRNAHFAASDAVHNAQGAMFEVNAEVAKLESEIRLIAESRTRLSAQVDSLVATRNVRLNEHAELRQRAVELVQAIADMVQQLEEAKASVSAHEAKLPQLEQTYRTTRDAVTAAQADAALAEQSIEAAAAEQRNADRQLAQLAQRRERLSEEQASIGSPDEAQLAGLKQQLAKNESEVAAGAESQQRSEANVDRMTEQRQQRLDDRARQVESTGAARSASAGAEASAGECRGEREARSVAARARPREFAAPVSQAGRRTRLGDCVRSGVARARAGRRSRQARHDRRAWPRMRRRRALRSIRPAAPSGRARSLPQMAGFRRLSELVRTHDAAFAALLADWLANVFVADDLAAALAARGELPAGRAVRRTGGAPCVAPRRALLRGRRSGFGAARAPTGDRESRARSPCAAVDRRSRRPRQWRVPRRS